ncbi:MAG: hypothetical protein N2C12_01725 [Planctomycetales bacterium]
MFSKLKYLRLAYFSKPSCQRQLYRAVKRHGVRSILVLGVDVELAVPLIGIAGSNHSDSSAVSYTGIDLFESRPAGQTPASLKHVFKQLSGTCATIKLVPGDPYEGLSRTANSLLGTDLVIIGSDHVEEALCRAWFYLPRILHTDSLVYQQGRRADGEIEYHPVSHSEIECLAKVAARRRAA